MRRRYAYALRHLVRSRVFWTFAALDLLVVLPLVEWLSGSVNLGGDSLAQAVSAWGWLIWLLFPLAFALMATGVTAALRRGRTNYIHAIASATGMGVAELFFGLFVGFVVMTVGEMIIGHRVVAFYAAVALMLLCTPWFALLFAEAVRSGFGPAIGIVSRRLGDQFVRWYGTALLINAVTLGLQEIISAWSTGVGTWLAWTVYVCTVGLHSLVTSIREDVPSEVS